MAIPKDKIAFASGRASAGTGGPQLIDERISTWAIDDTGDLAWAKPFVDEARAAVARGEFVSLEEHKSHNRALLASLQRRPG